MNIRKAINLVVYSLLEKAEGKYHQKLSSLFKGRLTFAEFNTWVDKNTPEDTDDEDVTQYQLEQLAELREQGNGSWSVG